MKKKNSFSGLRFPHMKNSNVTVMQIKQEDEIYALQSKPL